MNIFTQAFIRMKHLQLLFLIFLVHTVELKAQFSIGSDLSAGCKPLKIRYFIQTLPGADPNDTIVSVLWNFGGGLESDTTINPVVIYDTLGFFITSCQITTPVSLYNITFSETVKVINCNDSLWIPNVFSPNEDNINDVFYVDTDGIHVYSFSVFTRSGTLVYQSESPTIRWDGRSLSGHKMKTGVYYYIIRRLDEAPLREEKGIIYLYD